MLSSFSRRAGSLVDLRALRRAASRPPPEYRPGVPVLPNIFVVCMHKAASTFVADVLLPSIALRTAYYDLCNVGSLLILYRQKLLDETGALPAWAEKPAYMQLKHYFRAEPLPRSNQVVGRVYPQDVPVIEQELGEKLPSKNQRAIVVRRDPRDALVSLYYSRAVSHSDTLIASNQALFRRRRQQLRAQTPTEGVKSMLRGIRENVVSQQFMSCTDFLLKHPTVGDLPYEMLINQPREWLTRFVEFGELHAVVDENWYEEMLGHLQPPTVEDPTQHKRRMKTGNWREVFDDELCELLEARVGQRMRQFGYTWDGTAKLPMRAAA